MAGKKINKNFIKKQQIHPAKTKLSSLCFAELELKGKRGSQEGKWVSKEIESSSCVVVYCAVSVRPGLIELMSVL